MKKATLILIIFTLFSCSEETVVPEHIQRLANAEVHPDIRCGNLTSAAFNEIIPVHDDKDIITFTIPSIPDHIDSAYITNNIIRAYEQWSEIIGIPIEKTPHHDIADIIVEFQWLDGIGGVLGKADYPKLAQPQKIVFDLYDIHVLEEAISFDFFTIALHEAGHTLGIPHIGYSAAVMWPAYRQKFTSLNYPDIFEAKKRYNLTETFIDQFGRTFTWIKKKITHESTPTSSVQNSSPSVEIMTETDIG